MKIIEPEVTLWKQGNDVVKHVAKCARVCYGKEVGNDKRLYEQLQKRNHNSMFRHESVYAIIPMDNYLDIYSIITPYIKCPYIDHQFYNQKLYISTNGNFMMDNKFDKIYTIINNHRVSEEEFENTEIGFNMMRYTFKIVTQISTSRELNRVSPNAIAEQSTRYVHVDGAICRPHWISREDADNVCIDYLNVKNTKLKKYVNGCVYAFTLYKVLIECDGVSIQDARGVLPLDTATTCVYTYSVEEWKNIINLRYNGTTGKPHPNAKLIVGSIKNILNELGYEL